MAARSCESEGVSPPKPGRQRDAASTRRRGRPRYDRSLGRDLLRYWNIAQGLINNRLNAFYALFHGQIAQHLGMDGTAL